MKHFAEIDNNKRTVKIANKGQKQKAML